MDRIALSKRIGGLADVFANDSQMRNELLAMSRALELMPDEKFATILSEAFDADEPMAAQEADATVRGFGMAGPTQKATPYMLERGRAMRGQPDQPPVFEPRDPKKALQALLTDPKVQEAIQSNPQLAQMAKTAGLIPEEEAVSEETAPQEGTANSWSREATDAVIRNLVGDVLGKEAMDKVQCCDTSRQLTKEQTPDGEKKAEKPSTLKPEQTPDIAESIDSDMYAKSKGAVRKEASKEAAEEPKEAEAAKAEEVVEEVVEAPAPKEEEAEPTKAQEQKAERKEQKAEKKEEEAAKGAEQAAEALKDLGEMKKEASDQGDQSMTFEGIELTAPMADVELTQQDIDTLGKLF